MDACVEADNAGPFSMTITDTFSIVGDLAGIMAGIVSVSEGILLVNFRFPMNECGGIELADLQGWSGIIAETANRAVHDVTRYALNAIDEIAIFLFIERTIINLPVAEVRIVEALLDEGDVVGVIDQNPADELERIRRVAGFGHVNPTGSVAIVPLAPRERVVVVVRVHGQRQPEISHVIDAGGAAGFFLRPAQGRQKQGGENGDNGNDHQQLDQSEAGLGLRFHECWDLIHSKLQGALCKRFQT